VTPGVASLNRYPLVRTRSPDELRDALARVYAKPSLCFDGRAGTGETTFNYCQLHNIGLGYSKYGTGVRLAYSESSYTLQTFPVHGRGEATFRDTVSALHPRHGVIVSAGVSYEVKVDAGYEHFVLVMDDRVLTDKLSALTGASIKRPLRFRPCSDRQNPVAEALRSHFFFLVANLSAPVGSLPGFVLTEFEQTLMVMFLHAQPHNYGHLLERQPSDIALQPVRRAEEYIEANSHEPIRLEDLAAIAGVSAFSLFRAFRKYRGYSPRQFIAHVRSKRGGWPS
jgi:AraC-binding-like domain